MRKCFIFFTSWERLVGFLIIGILGSIIIMVVNHFTGYTDANKLHDAAVMFVGCVLGIYGLSCIENDEKEEEVVPDDYDAKR